MMIKFFAMLVFSALIAVSDIAIVDAVMLTIRGLLWLVQQQDVIEFLGASLIVGVVLNQLTGE